MLGLQGRVSFVMLALRFARKRGREGLRGNAIVAGDLALGVDVDFGEGELAWLAFRGGELLEDWRDHFARAAPVGVEVDHGVG